MRDMTIEQTEEEMLTHEVCDEALESAAGTGSEKVGKYTLYYCTAAQVPKRNTGLYSSPDQNT
jgi:hypothetical protein